MLEIINKPWRNTFLKYVSESKKSIKIYSPYVKYNAINDIYKHKNINLKIFLITNFAIQNFHQHSSDIKAIKYLLENKDIVRNFQRLHAKIYIFDDREAIITSANLTNAGLDKNYEYGIFSNDIEFVNKVCEDFDDLYHNEDAGTITIESINIIENILNNIPKEKKIKYPEIIFEKTHDEDIQFDTLFSGGIESIENSLSGWKCDVFKQLVKINMNIFNLEDIYKYIPDLQKLHPDNKHITDKIRQQLQILRDIGLIKFLGNGKYQKLWMQE